MYRPKLLSCQTVFSGISINCVGPENVRYFKIICFELDEVILILKFSVELILLSNTKLIQIGIDSILNPTTVVRVS